MPTCAVIRRKVDGLDESKNKSGRWSDQKFPRVKIDSLSMKVDNLKESGIKLPFFRAQKDNVIVSESYRFPKVTVF